MEEKLKAALNQAITDFNNSRSKILKLAFNEGGQEAVTNLENQYDALRNAYFDLLKKQLDKNNDQYEKLVVSTREEAEKLTVSIQKLNQINDIIQLVTSVFDLAETILKVLAK